MGVTELPPAYKLDTGKALAQSALEVEINLIPAIDVIP
jgi:hypothetical protein